MDGRMLCRMDGRTDSLTEGLVMAKPGAPPQSWVAENGDMLFNMVLSLGSL